MNRFLGTVSIILLATSMVAAQGERCEGDWQGALKVQGFELRIVFHVSKNEKGELTASMDSPDQGAKGIAVDSVHCGNETIRLTVLRVRGEYEGMVEPGDSTIKGNWKQSGMTFPLNLRRSEVPVVVLRPQEPKPPYPYFEEEVSFQNKMAGIRLAGTLTLPKSGGPFPAVVLITGSGPQNRDETIFNHKPFKVIADYLTRKGIVVLRYDDRGTAASTGNFASATTMDFASDAGAAVDYLKSRREIDARNVGLIGHSEGGLIAPIVAGESPDVAFIILLAGPSLMGKDIILLQDSLISLANGVPIDRILENRERARTMYSIIKSENDTAALHSKLVSFLHDVALQMNESDSELKIEGGIERTVQQVSSPWFRFFLFYDPVPALRKVHCPVLALNGKNDLQVPSRVNLEGIDRAVREGGNPQVKVEEFPELNHLFQHSHTGSPLEYVKIEETFAPEVLRSMSDWIDSVVRGK